MNHTQMSARVGLFFLLGVILIWVTYEALHNGKLNHKKGYTVTAAFSSLKELKAGDDVRMAGVKVGTVEKTQLANGKAEAVLLIQNEVALNRDSVATIAMAGLLGSNYVSLTLGSAESGVVIQGEALKTKDAADLNQIMSDLGNLGQELKSSLSSITGSLGGGSDGKGGLFQKLDRLVEENSTKISATTANLEAITAKIRSGEGTLGKLVNDPAAYDQLNSTLAEIKAAATEAKTFMASTQDIVAQVKSGQGTLGALIYDQQSGENIKIVAKNLRDLSEKLNNPKSTFGQLINDDSLIRDAQATLRKVDRAVEGMGDSGPITAVGVVAGKLF